MKWKERKIYTNSEHFFVIKQAEFSNLTETEKLLYDDQWYLSGPHPDHPERGLVLIFTGSLLNCKIYADKITGVTNPLEKDQCYESA